MPDNFLERARDAIPNKDRRENREDHEYQEDSTSKELKDLYTDILEKHDQEDADKALASITKIPEKKETKKVELSPIDGFIKKNHASLSPGKKAVLTKAVEKIIDPFDPGVLENKVQANNNVASLLWKMWFAKRAEEDTFA